MFTGTCKLSIHKVYREDGARQVHGENSFAFIWRYLQLFPLFLLAHRTDSLTEGYFNFGLKFNPYTNNLAKLLQDEFGDAFEITTAGLAGERTVDMKIRLRAMLEIFKLKGISFSICILLAGTNDIGTYGVDSETIWGNFVELYQILEDHNIAIIPVTIPQSAFHMDWYVAKRNYLNDRIKLWNSPKFPSVPIFDLEQLIPFSKESGYWDDSLHLNASGYDLMGDLIFSSIKQFLKDFINRKDI
jgi:lysophospholipase L1-like esterase